MGHLIFRPPSELLSSAVVIEWQSKTNEFKEEEKKLSTSCRSDEEKHEDGKLLLLMATFSFIFFFFYDKTFLLCLHIEDFLL